MLTEDNRIKGIKNSVLDVLFFVGVVALCEKKAVCSLTENYVEKDYRECVWV